MKGINLLFNTSLFNGYFSEDVVNAFSFEYYTGTLFELSVETYFPVSFDYYSGETLNLSLETLITPDVDYFCGSIAFIELQETLLIQCYPGSTFTFDVEESLGISISAGETFETEFDTLISVNVDQYSGETSNCSLDTLISVDVNFYQGTTAETDVEIDILKNDPRQVAVHGLFPGHSIRQIALLGFEIPQWKLVEETPCRSGFNAFNFNSGLFNHVCEQKTTFSPTFIVGSTLDISLKSETTFDIDAYSGQTSETEFETLITVNVDQYSGETFTFDVEESLGISISAGETFEIDLDTLISVDVDYQTGSTFTFDVEESLGVSISAGETFEIDVETDTNDLNVSFLTGSTVEFEFNTETSLDIEGYFGSCLSLNLLTDRRSGGGYIDVEDCFESRRSITVTIRLNSVEWKQTLKVETLQFIKQNINIINITMDRSIKTIRATFKSIQKRLISIKRQGLRES